MVWCVFKYVARKAWTEVVRPLLVICAVGGGIGVACWGWDQMQQRRPLLMTMIGRVLLLIVFTPLIGVVVVAMAQEIRRAISEALDKCKVAHKHPH